MRRRSALEGVADDATGTQSDSGAPESNGGEAGGRSVHRSPNYPFVSLPEAIELARKIHAAEGRHPVRYEIVAKHWGIAAKSSVASQSISALRQYGLMEVQAGQGLTRTVCLTDRALKILLDTRPEHRVQPLRDAALSPKLYAELWAKWGDEPPSDENAESYLIVDRRFNPSYAKGVLANYKASIAIASLGNSGSLAEGSGDIPEPGQDDMDQESAREASASAHPGASKRQPASLAGEEEYFRAKLAGGRLVRVLFQGSPPTRATIGKLIAHLELVKDEFPDNDLPNT